MGCAFTNQQRQAFKIEDSHRGRMQTIDCRRRSTRVTDSITENIIILSNSLSQSQIAFCAKKLSTHQLFNTLSLGQLSSICKDMVYVKAQKGEYLFHQNDSGHSFFLIEHGTIDVEIDEKVICTLSDGQSFGQLALLFRTSRAASIVCKNIDATFFLMKPALYKEVLQRMKTQQYSKNKIIIDKISLFQCLTNKQKYSLTSAIKSTTYKAGEVIFQSGDPSQALYIVSEGQIRIDLPGKQPLHLTELQMFGQSSLRPNSKRQGSATAVTQSVCLLIGRKDIQKALSSDILNLYYYNIQKWALMRSTTFKDYNSNQINQIILAIITIPIEKNQKIDKSKYPGIIVNLDTTINNYPPGNIFNLASYENGTYSLESLTSKEAGHIGYLSFEKLKSILSSIENKKKLFKASQKCIPQNVNEIQLTDFQYLKKLGEGQFGQVYLVKNPNLGGHLYAIKCLSKSAVKQQQMEQSVAEQKKILQKAIFPYIVGFVKAFHDKTNIFLLLEYIKGKQMFDVIREMPTLNKAIARYYFGCIMLSIEYLHANNIIYRDIKPENSVIDHRGKAYLIDMGTAKELISSKGYKTFTIIGTPHYMAPQIFEGKGYSFQTDYWSLGILLYEFICGKVPFGQNVQNDPYCLYSIIKRGKVQFPKFLEDDQAKKIITFLLNKDPKMRASQVSFDKIKQHPYFDGFSWEDLLEQRIMPPYIPRDFKKNGESFKSKDPIPFLSYIYGKKSNGKIEQWNEEFGL